jgi:hypothetical protein
MLRTAFGPAIARFLEDSAVVEVMLNPDGRLWIDRLSSGLADTGEIVPAPDGERRGPARFGGVTRDGRALRGAIAPGGCSPSLRDSQAGGRCVHAG